MICISCDTTLIIGGGVANTMCVLKEVITFIVKGIVNKN